MPYSFSVACKHERSYTASDLLCREWNTLQGPTLLKAKRWSLHRSQKVPDLLFVWYDSRMTYTCPRRIRTPHHEPATRTPPGEFGPGRWPFPLGEGPRAVLRFATRARAYTPGPRARARAHAALVPGRAVWHYAPICAGHSGSGFAGALPRSPPRTPPPSNSFSDQNPNATPAPVPK